MARYRDGNKTDRADAKALLEASRNHALTHALFELIAEIRSPEERADAVRASLTSPLHGIPNARRLMTVPGGGVLTALAKMVCGLMTDSR